MRKKVLLLIWVLNFFNLVAQEKSLYDRYTTYFENQREVPYLHLNKTSFFIGEEIWFKAYVLNLNTKKLHENTSNLYCTIYDDKGVYKDQKLIYVKDGVARGSFQIDSTFTKETYYIKASTNFMRNFEEDESFIQKITIVNHKKQQKIREESSFDLQILPEGGHLLANSYNTLGVILNSKDGQIPIVKKAELIDVNTEESLLEFQFNSFGQAKIGAKIASGKVYEVKVTLENGKKLRKKLPLKSLKGVTLSFEDISSNMAKFTVTTNEETLEDLIGRKYAVLIHNTNSYLKRHIEFKANRLSYSLLINKKLFKPGTNIVTLFTDEDKPVAERVFFSYSPSLFNKLAVETSKISEDSLTLSLSNKEKSEAPIYLSASFLPKETKSYAPKHTIYTNFFIKPYIKGELKNVNDLFKNTNRKKLRALDILLLTQGWSKYNWNSIFYNAPKNQFKFEKGITIKGTLNDNKTLQEVKEIHLITNGNKLFISKEVAGNKVTFKNIYVRDSSVVNFSFLDKENFKKPNLYVQVSPHKRENNITIYEEVSNISNFFDNDFSDVNSLINKKGEVLNEVEVKGRLKIKNNPVMFGGDRRAFKIDNKHSKNQRILEFIRYKRFLVQEDESVVTINVRKAGRDFLPSRVFINNVEITFNRNDMLALRQMRLDEIDEIFTSNTGRGEIHIFTKPDIRSIETPFFSYKMPFGFSVEKEYYQPKYLSTTNKVFRDYGVVYWEPEITIDKDTYQFTIPKLGQNEITLFLEGISKDGRLISVQKTFTDLKKINN